MIIAELALLMEALDAQDSGPLYCVYDKAKVQLKSHVGWHNVLLGTPLPPNCGLLRLSCRSLPGIPLVGHPQCFCDLQGSGVLHGYPKHHTSQHITAQVVLQIDAANPMLMSKTSAPGMTVPLLRPPRVYMSTLRNARKSLCAWHGHSGRCRKAAG